MSVAQIQYFLRGTDGCQELARQQSLSNDPPGQSPNPGDFMKVVYLAFLAFKAAVLCLKGDKSFKKLVGTPNWDNASKSFPPELRALVDEIGKCFELFLLAFNNQSQNYTGQESGEDSGFLLLEPMSRPKTLLPTVQEARIVP
ncbi:MAG: hypothetical protein AAGF04_02420 [Chlamydiota bacterium]